MIRQTTRHAFAHQTTMFSLPVLLAYALALPLVSAGELFLSSLSRIEALTSPPTSAAPRGPSLPSLSFDARGLARRDPVLATKHNIYLKWDSNCARSPFSRVSVRRGMSDPISTRRKRPATRHAPAGLESPLPLPDVPTQRSRALATCVL